MFKVTKRRILVFTAFTLISIWMAYEMMFFLRFGKPSVVWSKASTESIDTGRFRVVLFPRANSNKQSDIDLKNQTGLIDRAILVSLDELEHESITVYADAERGVEVATNRFTALPPDGNVDKYIRKLNDAIKEWQSETDWRKIDFRMISNSDESEQVTIEVYSKRGDAFEYEYEVDSGGEVTPNAYRLHRRKF